MSKSTTGAFATVCGALGAVLILTILLISGRQSANAATGVTDPVTGQIKQVAIDTNITGNAPGTGGTNLLGPVDPVVANVPLGTTQLVDIIVDEVAPADGIVIGVGFNLHYDPAIVSINGHTFNYLAGAGGFEPGTVNDPDTSGNWREDVAAFSGGHTGEGIAVEVGIKCGNTIGSSTLTLDDEQTGNSYPGIFGKTNTNGDPTVAIPVQSVGNATIYCGEGAITATPSPTATATGVTNTPTESPTATATGVTNTPTESPTATATGVTNTPTATATGVTNTPTATPTQTPTNTPTPSPTATATHTPTPTPTPTPRPSGTTAGATTAHLSGTPTPAALPKTGGPADGSSSMTTLLLVLALGAGLILAASGSVAFARARRRE